MNKPNHYNLPAQTLHWLIAILFVGLCVIGFRMTRLPDDDLAQIFSLYQLHKSLGISLLIMMVMRIVVRSWFGSPAYDEGAITLREKTMARLAHAVLYVLLLAVPMLGWAMVSASPYNIPTVLFDTLSWPHLPPFDSIGGKASTENTLKALHKIAAYSLVFLTSIHVLAALRHQFILRDSILNRMLPLRFQFGKKGRK